MKKVNPCILFILALVFILADCKKKKQPEPSQPPATGGSTTGTPATPQDTFKRVSKPYQIYIRTYCNYEGRVSITLSDKELISPTDSVQVIFKTKDSLRLTRATKFRYINVSYSSYQQLQDVNGHLPCNGDYAFIRNGITLYSKKDTVLQGGKKGGSFYIDLYK